MLLFCAKTIVKESRKFELAYKLAVLEILRNLAYIIANIRLQQSGLDRCPNLYKHEVLIGVNSKMSYTVERGTKRSTTIFTLTPIGQISYKGCEITTVTE